MKHATADDKGRRTASGAGAGGLSAALAVFVVYLLTLAPTVLSYDYPVMRDASAFQVKAYLLGIPDVTGYPTYVMLTHLFTYLPFGDPAYRLNLASAVFGAGAVFFVYLVCLRLTRRIPASAAGAVLFGTSETFWSQAVVAEVYTLNALFVAVMLLVLLVWREERSDRYLLLFAFLAGLSLTHHLTSGLLLPAGLLFVFLVGRGKPFEWRLLFKGMGLFLLGLLPYLYLPVRASADSTLRTVSVDPTLMTHDPSTFGGFLDLVTGGEFRGAMFGFGPAELPACVVRYLGYLLEQFYPGFLAVALLGVAYLLVKDRAALALLGSLYLGWLFYALEYDIADVYYQFIPTYLILAVFAAVGFSALLRGAEGLAAGGPARTAVVAVASTAVMLAPFVGVGQNYTAVDRSEDYEGRRALEIVAEEAGSNATVIHHRSPLWYMSLVEERRTDVELVASYELALTDREVESAAAALRAGRPAYILYPGVSDGRYMTEAGLNLIAIERGVLYEVVSRDADRG